MPLLGAGFCGLRVLDGLLQRHRPALGQAAAFRSHPETSQFSASY